jgi:peptidoglycan-associated lipoprotein
MRIPYRLLTVTLAAGLLAVFAAGCAKKAVEAPPVPPPAPPVVQTEPTPAAPVETPTPAPVAAAKVTASDFTDVFFDLDSYALRDDARTALGQAARLLRDNPGVNLVIEGHCDERGTVEYNQALGEKRANAARDYLANAGVQAARLQTVSYGKERPFAEGHDESAWAQNRRAHFVLR